jgi:hypothetical protein
MVCIAMLDAAINKVVRLTITMSPWELERSLASLSYRARLDIRRDLQKAREAHRFERSRHCVYYFQCQGSRVIAWRWSNVDSDAEAIRMRTLVKSLDGRLDVHRANQVFENATRRTLRTPRRGTPSSPAHRAAG